MAGNGELAIDVVVDPIFGENCYLVRLAGRDECVVIDPGLDVPAIQEQINSLQLQVVAVLNTHGHSDHIAGNQALKQDWPTAPLLIGELDAPKLSDPFLNLSAQFGQRLVSPPADQLLQDGDKIEFADLPFEVALTPGHCCGHVIFIYRGSDPWTVFGGDVLFRMGIGRTDFPDGSFEELAESIQQRLYTLPKETKVYPGHGEPTTVGFEAEHNPFVSLG